MFRRAIYHSPVVFKREALYKQVILVLILNSLNLYYYFLQFVQVVCGIKRTVIDCNLNKFSIIQNIAITIAAKFQNHNQLHNFAVISYNYITGSSLGHHCMF